MLNSPVAVNWHTTHKAIPTSASSPKTTPLQAPVACRSLQVIGLCSAHRSHPFTVWSSRVPPEPLHPSTELQDFFLGDVVSAAHETCPHAGRSSEKLPLVEQKPCDFATCEGSDLEQRGDNSKSELLNIPQVLPQIS